MKLLDGIVSKLVDSGKTAVQQVAEGQIVTVVKENPTLLAIGLGIIALILNGDGEKKQKQQPPQPSMSPITINNYYSGPQMQRPMVKNAPKKEEKR